MRKRTKITIDPKYILITIAIICVVMIAVSFKYENKMKPVRSVAGSIVTPMQKGISQIGSGISHQISYLTTVKTLVKKNKSLQTKLDEASTQNKLLQQDKYELENFRKLYKLDKQYSGYPKVAARVISSNPDNWYNTFVIDKGSKDGLKVNMNVMAGDGLVGIITKVNKTYSLVQSVTDDESNITGSLLRTSTKCMVSGNLRLMDQGVIDLSGVPLDAKIKDGDKVVTSSISYKYLPGILIGYAKDMKKDASNMTQSGHLTPAADFSKLDMVLVITKVKDSGDLEDILK